MNKLCIIKDSPVGRKVDKIASLLNISYDVVHDIVKQWFDTHPIYTEKGNLSQKTVSVNNMPLYGYISELAFELRPISTSDNMMIARYRLLIESNTNTDNKNIFIFSSEETRNKWLELRFKNGFVSDAFKQFTNYEGFPCVKVARYLSIQFTTSQFKDKVFLTSVIDEKSKAYEPDHIAEHDLETDTGKVIVTASNLNFIVRTLRRWPDILKGTNTKVSDIEFPLKKNWEHNRDVENAIDAIEALVESWLVDGVPQSILKLIGDNLLALLFDDNSLSGGKFLDKYIHHITDARGNETVIIDKRLTPLYTLYTTHPIKLLMRTFNGGEHDFANLNLFFDNLYNGKFNIDDTGSGTGSLFNEFKLKTTEPNDAIKANTATLYVGYGKPKSAANNYMHQYELDGRSLSKVDFDTYNINTDINVTSSDIVFVYVDNKNFLHDELEATKNAIRYIFDRGGSIIMDSFKSNNTNDIEIQQWIQSEFGLQPVEYMGQFNVYRPSLTNTIINNNKFANQALFNQESALEVIELEATKPYEHYYQVNVKTDIPLTITDLKLCILKIGPSNRIRFNVKNMRDLILLTRALKNNNIPLYKIKGSGINVKLVIDDKKELRKFLQFANENNVLVHKNENGDFYITQYEYTTYMTDDEIKRNLLYEKLFLSDRIKASELTALSKAAIFKLSDLITDLMEKQETRDDVIKLLKMQPDAFASIDFKKATRIGVILKIGLSNLMLYIKLKYFTPQNRTDAMLLTPEVITKLSVINKNFEAFIEFGQKNLSQLESISLSLSTNIKSEIADLFDPDDEQEIQEIFGSSLEHWQIGFRLISVFSSLSSLIKSKIDRLLDYNQDGTVKYNQFGFEEHINASEAVALLLSFVQYAYDVDDMIAKLRLHLESNPWLQQIIDILEDPKEQLFKSLFYTNFKKYFLSYGILYKDSDKQLKMKIINEHENSDLIKDVVYRSMVNRSSGANALFKANNHVNEETFNRLLDNASKLSTRVPMRENAVILQLIFEDLNIPTAHIAEIAASLSNRDITNIPLKLKALLQKVKQVNSLSKLYELLDTDEFKYFISLSNKSYSSGIESMSYESGKLYYSYVLPSFLNMYIGMLKGNVDPSLTYDLWIDLEFGQYSWFKKDGRWRNSWLNQLMKSEEARDVLLHKVLLNNQGVEYDLKSPIQYIESVVKEFFYDTQNKYAWYRIPIMSNKPSEEYIRFYRIHEGYDTYVVKWMIQTAWLELDRIIAVKQRKDAPNKILRFDGKRGELFCFLDFLNDNQIVLKYIDDKLNGRAVDNVLIKNTVEQEITNYLESLVDKTINNWVDIGFLGRDLAGKLISPTNINLGRSTEEVRESVREFVYNDTLAAINILLMTIVDPAFYKDTEDIQKRLAQIHAPGMRPDLLAIDTWNKHKFSDGIFRTVIIKDFKMPSTVLNDLADVFDLLIAKETNVVRRDVLVNKKRYILDAFSEINIADGQGYSSPSSYRKKMGLFGKWGQRQEDAYKRIKRGEFTNLDLDVAFLPLKPFVFGFTKRNGYNDIMPQLKVGMLCKNSEYLLVMADALLRSAGKTNYLTALFDVMEESYGDAVNDNGIDTILFESAIKTGNTGAIDISELAIEKYKNDHDINMSSEDAVRGIIRERIYRNDHTYNTDVVAETSFNNYAILQEVPAHFKSRQQQGSQSRILLFAGMNDSDILEYTEYKEVYDGDKVSYVEQRVKTTVAEAKLKYFDAITDNIEMSRNELMRELDLNDSDLIAKNVALSRILRLRILTDTRMNTDMLYACSINKDGEFNIPLSDPVQSDMIMKLLNSLIKNRINKLEIAGGPVVLVSRFGSRQLAIRYSDKNGHILLTEQEFEDYVLNNKVPNVDFDKTLINKSKAKENTHNAYLEYKKKNKKATAYLECYAPIYDDNLVKDFADKDGNIDIEKIKKNNPKLLEMVGYRIPTESHYSMIPLKIVGFTPRESGEGILLPDEFVTMSGSDKISLFLPL